MPGEARRFATWLGARPKPIQDVLDVGDGFQPPTRLPPPRRYCKCVSPDWVIEAREGHCRFCGGELREWTVRKWHAIARSERDRVRRKFAA